MPEGPWIADDRKVVLPPRDELHTSMESLIHHFKIVTEGYRVPEGEVYVTIESPRGEIGCYVVSDGGAKPWRVQLPRAVVRRARGDGDLLQSALISDMIAIVGSLDSVWERWTDEALPETLIREAQAAKQYPDATRR